MRLAEYDRRQAFRDDGATSVEAWSAELFGLSVATARSYCHVADKTRPLPHLVGSLCAGEISFDKVRAVVDVATPRTDQALCAQAKELGVRELAEVARTAAARARAASVSPSRSEHDSRYLRFNDGHRTVSMQLAAEAYAQTKACVDAWAESVSPRTEETRRCQIEDKIPLDQRRCDGFLAIVDSATPGHGSASGSASLEGPAPPIRSWWWPMCPSHDLVDRRVEPERSGGRARARWFDRPRDGAAHRL